MLAIPIPTRYAPFYRTAHLISLDTSTRRISKVGDTAEHPLCSTNKAHGAGIVANHVLPPACIYGIGIVFISTGSRPPSCPRSSHSNETEFYAEREMKSLRPNLSLFILTPLTHIILPNSLLCSHHNSSKVSIRMQKTPHPPHNSWIWCMSVSLHIDRSSQAIYFAMRSYFSMQKCVVQK